MCSEEEPRLFGRWVIPMNRIQRKGQEISVILHDNGVGTSTYSLIPLQIEDKKPCPRVRLSRATFLSIALGSWSRTSLLSRGAMAGVNYNLPHIAGHQQSGPSTCPNNLSLGPFDTFLFSIHSVPSLCPSDYDIDPDT